MPSYDVTADEEKNRLYITLEGMLDESLAEEVLADVDAATEKLEPGYDTVNDISEFKPVSQEAVDAIEEGKQLNTERGNQATVRVTGESVIGEMQWERHGTEAEGFHVATAESVEEADRLLDEYRERDDL